MSSGLLWVVTALYVGVGVSLYLDGRSGLGITFAGYALANLGLIYDILTKGH